MGFLNMFQQMEDACPSDSLPNQSYGNNTIGDPVDLGEGYDQFKDQPVYYRNADAWFGDSLTSNWYQNSPVLKVMDDEYRFPSMKPKVDPNKIFNTETAALKQLAADQQKAVRIFEKKLIEGLTDKNKFGLTEEDIEAMQALTAARTAITNIAKEQVAIKKNIADIRIKQEQASDKREAAAAASQGGSDGFRMSNNDFGKSFLDSLFDVPTAVSTPPAPVEAQYQSVDPNTASAVLDDIIGGTVDARVQYESNDPKTYVLVGDSDADTEFITIGSDGNEIPDYPTPQSHIDKIDRDRGVAVDDLLVEYPLKFKN